MGSAAKVLRSLGANKQLLDEVFVISVIIKISASVIGFGRYSAFHKNPLKQTWPISEEA